ncbi:hypothetical protein J6590_099739 [Homalodisca vitripennis]|nr:hypothetical protein J6590_099739 [Homalodisca vitripennis]
MASRGHLMLNLALSTVVDSQNIRDDNNVTSRQKLNLQNEDSVPVLPERDTNIQPMETMNPSTTRALNEEDILCLAQVSEKSLKRRARNQIPIGTSRKLLEKNKPNTVRVVT